MPDVARDHVHVAAPAEACFDLVGAFESYPVWAADVRAVSVLGRDAEGRASTVAYVVRALGREIRYALTYDYVDAPAALSWQLVEGDLLRELDGRYTFAAVDGGTEVSYELRVDLAAPMPGIVKRRVEARIVHTALRDLKQAVESREPRRPPLVPTGSGTDAPGKESMEKGFVMPDEPGEDEDPARPFHEVGTEERTLPAPSTIEVLFGEFLGAVPEVRDHLLAAADELLDAARALVEAADRVVRQHRDVP